MEKYAVVLRCGLLCVLIHETGFLIGLGFGLEISDLFPEQLFVDGQNLKYSMEGMNCE
jgi:hypothetical protein